MAGNAADTRAGRVAAHALAVQAHRGHRDQRRRHAVRYAAWTRSVFAGECGSCLSPCGAAMVENECDMCCCCCCRCSPATDVDDDDDGKRCSCLCAAPASDLRYPHPPWDLPARGASWAASQIGFWATLACLLCEARTTRAFRCGPTIGGTPMALVAPTRWADSRPCQHPGCRIDGCQQSSCK